MGISMFDAYLDVQANVTEALLRSEYAETPSKFDPNAGAPDQPEPSAEDTILSIFYKKDSRGYNQPVFKGGGVAYLRIAAAYMDEFMKVAAEGGSAGNLSIDAMLQRDLGESGYNDPGGTIGERVRGRKRNNRR
jgi:hypothetical protein